MSTTYVITVELRKMMEHDVYSSRFVDLLGNHVQHVQLRGNHVQLFRNYDIVIQI